MGEHSAWDKYTNFDLAHRAPMMLHVPGVIEQVGEFINVRCDKFSEAFTLVH